MCEGVRVRGSSERVTGGICRGEGGVVSKKRYIHVSSRVGSSVSLCTGVRDAGVRVCECEGVMVWRCARYEGTYASVRV